MKLQNLTAVLIAVLLLAAAAQAPKTLEVARSLVATKYKDWHYGPNSANNQVDCVQFLVAVVEGTLGQGKVPAACRKRILLAELSEEEKKNLEPLILSSDARIKGVQSALVEANLGTAVQISDVAPGDLI